MMFYRRIFTFLFIVSIFSGGCHKFDRQESVPAFIRINKCILSCDSITQGSQRNYITDVWVNIDGNRQGTYEMPVTFPVLNTGSHVISLRPGIKVNGIGAERMPYPFLNIVTIDTVLSAGNILEITPKYTYNPLTVFEWKENFENNGFTLDRMTKSDTTLFTSFTAENPTQHYGEFHIDANRPIFEYKSTEKYEALLSQNVFLEFDYKCDHPFMVGMVLYKIQNSIEYPILTVNPYPSGFHHIYVDLGTTLLANSDAVYFNIFFAASLESDYTKGYGMIDNIKLLHF